MDCTKRERIEWANSWWAEANMESPRILLIGDSTTRQFRGSMEMLMKNAFAIDLFAASFSVYDHKLHDNMECFFGEDEYRYDVIVLHYGVHHGLFKLCRESLENYNLYMEQYRRLVQYLYRKCNKIVIVTGTSEVMDQDLNQIDTEWEKEVIKRNSIAISVAQLCKCKVFDLYTLMKENQGIYKHCDRQHFSREADYFISYQLSTFMLNEKIIDRDFASGIFSENRKRIEKYLGAEKRYLIYGAGYFAQELYWILKQFGLEKNIECFVVSNQKNTEELFGISVKLIDSLSECTREEDVIIISSQKFEEQMKHTAVELNFKHIRFSREVKWYLEAVDSNIKREGMG